MHRLQGELRRTQAIRRGGSRPISSELEAETCFRQALEIARHQQAKALLDELS